MSRLHPAQQKNDLFDSYLNTMLKNKRPERQARADSGKPVRDKSLTRASNNTSTNNNNQLVLSRTVPKYMKNDEIRSKASSEELVHKEVFNNNMATVEVTVRTVAPKGTETKCMADDKRETWGKILLNRKSDDNLTGTFVNFDPLRTLHFLSKELLMKMQSVCPGDPNLQQIVIDMQNAIQRLPPDIITQLSAADANVTQFNGDSEIPVFNKKSDTQVIKTEKDTQTVIIGDAETKRMQKQLEDSASKLETNCKEMEELCQKLRNERDDLKSKLLSERETVTSLRKELNEVITNKTQQFNQELGKITSERDSFKALVQNLESQLETKVNNSSEELRAILCGLQSKQISAEQENTSLKNEITIMKLEKDKLMVMLECRDKQLKELRGELECIQQLVTNQMFDVRTKPAFSTTSSLSSISGIWNIPATSRSQISKYGKSVHELFMNNDAIRKMMENDLKFSESDATTTLIADDMRTSVAQLIKDDSVAQKEKQCTTSQMTFTDGGSVSGVGGGSNGGGCCAAGGSSVSGGVGGGGSNAVSSDDFMKSKYSSLKDIFAEIKRQAFIKIANPKSSNILATSIEPTNNNYPSECTESSS